MPNESSDVIEGSSSDNAHEKRNNLRLNLAEMKLIIAIRAGYVEAAEKWVSIGPRWVNVEGFDMKGKGSFDISFARPNATKGKITVLKSAYSFAREKKFTNVAISICQNRLFNLIADKNDVEEEKMLSEFFAVADDLPDDFSVRELPRKKSTLLAHAVNRHATKIVEKFLAKLAEYKLSNSSALEPHNPDNLESYFGHASVSKIFENVSQQGYLEVIQLLVDHLKRTEHLHILVDAEQNAIPLLEAALTIDINRDQALDREQINRKASTAQIIYDSIRRRQDGLTDETRTLNRVSNFCKQHLQPQLFEMIRKEGHHYGNQFNKK